MEKEEAIALAKAMEISSQDPPKPFVPGLTPMDQEEVITIRIQPDVSACANGVDPDQTAVEEGSAPFAIHSQLFSSPEQKLRVSYCHHPMSVVRRQQLVC